MKTKNALIGSVIVIGFSTLATQVHAALPAAPLLNFTTATSDCAFGGTYPDACTAGLTTIVNGSYFAMDTNGSGAINDYPDEKTALTQNDGLRLKTTQSASGTHSGAPDGTESAGIDAAWSFFGNTGLHYTDSATNILSESGNIVTVDFSGWKVTWNGIPAINMGSGAWAGNSDGVANITCAIDCSIGDSFTLVYSATVPPGDPSGFGGVLYKLQLAGTIGSFNTAPVTTDFTRSVSSITASPAGTAFTIDLASRTTDVDNNLDITTLAITAPSANIATNCTPVNIVTNSDGTVTFPACTNGTYTFNYTFEDTYEISNISTVTVIAAGDPVPNANDDLAESSSTTAVEIDVLQNDDDNNIDPTTVTILTNAAHGTTSVNATTGVITYTADAGYTGVDSFTYTVDDAVVQTSNPAVVTVTVNTFNTPATPATFSVGTTAVSAGSTSGVITLENIGVADTNTPPEDRIVQSCIGGCFDFELSGLTPGANGSVVLPLSTPVPTKADPGNTITYRKLINGTWRTFDRSTGDTFRTAPGIRTDDGVSCPQPSSDEYTGLTAGHNCLLLNISDGGPNDADGLANGTVVDPGGLAEITRATGTDGCSMGGNAKARNHAEWLLLAGFIALLGWFNISRRKA